MLANIDPLFFTGFEERRYSAAEHTGSFEEIDLATLISGGIRNGNSRQSAAYDADCFLRLAQCMLCCLRFVFY